MATNSAVEVQYQSQLTKMVHGKNCLLSELIEDVKFLESCVTTKKKQSKFMKGVSISEQKKRVDNVLKSAKVILSIGGKVKKALVAKEKRIWGDMHWMTPEDKKQADMVYDEKQSHKKAKKNEEKTDDEEK